MKQINFPNLSEAIRNISKIKILKSISILTLFAFLNYLSSCGYYFKVRERDINSPETQAELNLKDKYVILHSRNYIKHIFNIEIQNESMIALISDISPEHRDHFTTKRKGGNRYKKRFTPDVINEVHLHVDDNIDVIEGNRIMFPISDVQLVQFYSKDNGATTASWLLPPVLVIGAIVAIVAASSCPFIYTFDGDKYNLAGELYGGATYSVLERHDFLELPEINQVNGSYIIKITNELNEIQYTNLAELLLIQHPENSTVMIDKYGEVQTILSPQPPRSCVSVNENDFTMAVREKDKLVFGFNDIGLKHSVNELILSFNNYHRAKNGKLILRAKNSVWADYAYGNFTRLFGTYYAQWDEEQKDLSKRKLQRNILNQDIPLSVSLETNEGWKFIDYFEVVGPLVYRDIVLPIDLSKSKSDFVKIKLETGFKFWELDYAAMDFTKNISVGYSILELENAIDENDNDVKQNLLKDDDNYLIQSEIGNEVILTYALSDEPAATENKAKTSIFFHSKGYYERIRDYRNDPDWISLITHKHKHSFSKYSKNEFEKVILKNNMTAGN